MAIAALCRAGQRVHFTRVIHTNTIEGFSILKRGITGVYALDKIMKKIAKAKLEQTKAVSKPPKKISIWFIIPLIVANAAIWSFSLYGLVPTVIALYERGYGRFSAVFFFIILPAIGLVLSAAVPTLLSIVGRRRPARMVAALCLIFLWPPFFILWVIAAAI